MGCTELGTDGEGIALKGELAQG